jgi:hypothetical protein
MAVYVDELQAYGWVIRGRKTESCHMFTDEIELVELHEVAAKIGMRFSWFQNKPSAPHYDLTPSRRAAAIAAGAIPVDRRTAVGIWQARRAQLAQLKDAA